MLKQSSILFKKKLFTNRESSDLPALIKAIDDKEEAEFISQLVLHLREHQITLGEVAVLFRNARDSFTQNLLYNPRIFRLKSLAVKNLPKQRT